MFRPLTEEEVEAFKNKAPNAPKCTPEAFRIDFSQGHNWKTFPFNRLAEKVFIEHFLGVARGGEYSWAAVPKELIAKDPVRIVLEAHMEHLRRLYREAERDDAKDRDLRERKRKAKDGRKATVGRQMHCMLDSF